MTDSAVDTAERGPFGRYPHRTVVGEQWGTLSRGMGHLSGTQDGRLEDNLETTGWCGNYDSSDHGEVNMAP